MDKHDPAKGEPDKGPLGDVLPHEDDPAKTTSGSLKQEDVEDRPNVGTVKPEDYPEEDRAPPL